jgi:nitroreductase
MTTSKNLFSRLRRSVAVFMLFAASLGLMSGAQAGEREDKQAAAADTPAAVKHGELVFHGNYCGVGNRAGADPIDALDVACMHHDACTPSGGIQSCACNARLAEEAGAIVQDPRQSPELKSLATLVGAAAAAGMTLCAPSAVVATPAAQVAPAPIAPLGAVADEPAVTTQAQPGAPQPAAPTSIAPPTDITPVPRVAPMAP